jgi:hypothetical protein
VDATNFLVVAAKEQGMNGSNSQVGGTYELRYDDLFVAGRGYAFPCDADGRVDLDALSERARINYQYARAVVGRHTSMPSVLQVCR